MHFPACRVAIVTLSICISRVHAAPQNVTTLKTKVQSFLATQGGNVTVPESVYSFSNGTALTCGILNAYRSSDLVTQQDGAEYITEAEQHWYFQPQALSLTDLVLTKSSVFRSPTAWLTPNCIFEPTTIPEVQFAVGILGITGSTYAIRSGGHSPFPGFASTNDGVLIAMHKMTTVEYDAATETVRLGMGNTWGDVYGALIPYERIVVGGRLAPVGMALVTGGKSLPQPTLQYFASANIMSSFELVLADGSLVTANATHNSDLWFAMKAGQNNFGVTTHITTKAYPMSAVWGGLRQWNGSQIDQVADAFAEYQRVGQLDTKSSVIADLVPTNDTLYVTLIYFAPVNSTPAAFDAFYKIPAVADNSKLHPNFLDLISVGPAQVVPRFSYGFSNLYLDDSQTYRDVINLCAKQGEKMKQVNGGTQVLIPQPISKTMVDAALTTGGRPQTLVSRAQLWMNMSWGWNLASDDAYVYKLIQETYEMVIDLTKQRGLWDPYIFLNDAFMTQKVLRSYGADSFAKMKAVSAKYDPHGMFQTQVPGGFKLN